MSLEPEEFIAESFAVKIPRFCMQGTELEPATRWRPATSLTNTNAYVSEPGASRRLC